MEVETMVFIAAVLVLAVVHAWSWRGAADLERQAVGARMVLTHIYHDSSDYKTVAEAAEALERLYGLTRDDLSTKRKP